MKNLRESLNSSQNESICFERAAMNKDELKNLMPS